MTTDTPAGAGQVLIRVSLLGSDPLIWRRLRLDGDLPLDWVHEVLQVVLGWEDSHLPRFTAKDPYARVTNDEFAQGWPPQWVPAEFLEEDYDRPEEQTTLAQLFEAGDGRAYYEYDFGDSWLHLLEHLSPVPEAQVPAWHVTGQNACPPEDCGGIDAYLDFLDALADPAHPGHLPALDAARELDFTAAEFDQARAQAELSRVQRRWQRRTP